MKDLCVREQFEKNGETKVSWNKIGIMFEAKGKEYVKLFHMPGVLVSVFEQKPKEEKGFGGE
jgi:hypothetical protein